jgi:hypothetical protein
MNDLISPILFNKIVIVPGRWRHELEIQKCKGLCDDLDSGNPVVQTHARSAILELVDAIRWQSEPRLWIELLERLVPKLKKLQSLWYVSSPLIRRILTKQMASWTYQPSNAFTPTMISRFIQDLGSIQTLRDLTIILEIPTTSHLRLGLSCEFPADFSLQPLSGLASLSITCKSKKRPTPEVIKEISGLLQRCPELEKFSFYIPRTGNLDHQISIRDMFAPVVHFSEHYPSHIRSLKVEGITVDIEHFRTHFFFKSLQALTMLADHSPSFSSHFAAICTLLREQEIHVKKFATDCLFPPEVFRYLMSYSGIEHLRLQAGRHEEDNSSALMNRFFSVVLPLHHNSLRKLKLGSFMETVWTGVPSRSQLDCVESCRGLTQFVCWVCITPTGSHVQSDRVLVSISFIVSLHSHCLTMFW